MAKYILKRSVQIVITFVFFQTILFVILDAQPGDIANQFLMNPRVSPEAGEQLRRNLGLDQPPLVRYVQWMSNALTGNLGKSFTHWPRDVIDVVLERAPRTLFLFVTASLASFYAGFTLGKQMAWRRGGVFEYGSTIVGVILYTVFIPWFGLLMLYLFGYELNVVPLGGFLSWMTWRRSGVDANYVFYRLILTGVALGVLLPALWLATAKTSAAKRNAVRIGGAILFCGVAIGGWMLSGIGHLAWDMIHHMILPLVVSLLVNYTGTMLLVRNTMLETLREDYVMAARAKGLRERTVRDRHAARNAFLPAFTALVISLPFTLSGGIITETVFSWEGMGLTLLNAVANEDIPLAMGALSIIGILALVAHLVADVMYAFLDPRIRYQ